MESFKKVPFKFSALFSIKSVNTKKFSKMCILKLSLSERHSGCANEFFHHHDDARTTAWNTAQMWQESTWHWKSIKTTEQWQKGNEEIIYHSSSKFIEDFSWIYFLFLFRRVVVEGARVVGRKDAVMIKQF